MESLQLKAYKILSSLSNFDKLEEVPKYKFWLSTNFNEEKKIIENQMPQVIGLHHYVKGGSLAEDCDFQGYFYFSDPFWTTNIFKESVDLLNYNWFSFFLLINCFDIFKSVEKCIIKKKLTQDNYDYVCYKTNNDASVLIINFGFFGVDHYFYPEDDEGHVFDSDSADDDEFRVNNFIRDSVSASRLYDDIH